MGRESRDCTGRHASERGARTSDEFELCTPRVFLCAAYCATRATREAVKQKILRMGKANGHVNKMKESFFRMQDNSLLDQKRYYSLVPGCHSEPLRGTSEYQHVPVFCDKLASFR